MPGNPKFDPFHQVRKPPKLEKSTDPDHKQIISIGGQDTSTYKLLGHSHHAFSGKCPETPNLTHFTESKWRQKEENQQTMTVIQSVLRKVPKIHQHATFQTIPSMRSPANTRKPLRTDGQTDGRADMPQNGHGWSDGPTDPCTGEKSLFQASDGQTDGRTTRKQNASGA